MTGKWDCTTPTPASKRTGGSWVGPGTAGSVMGAEFRDLDVVRIGLGNMFKILALRLRLKTWDLIFKNIFQVMVVQRI